MVNRVILAGYVADEPFIRATENGKFATLSIVTIEKIYVSKLNCTQRHTEWHKLTFWGKLADEVDSTIRVGDAIMVEGAIRTRKWEDKDGNSRKIVEIAANKLERVESIEGCELPDFIAKTIKSDKPEGKTSVVEITKPADDPDNLPF